MRNAGSGALWLLGARLQRPTADAGAEVVGGEDAGRRYLIPPGGWVSVRAWFAPRSPGVRRVLVLCLFSRQGAGAAAVAAASCALLLRAVDPAAAEDLALLAPVSAFTGPRGGRPALRPPQRTDVVPGEPLPSAAPKLCLAQVDAPPELRAALAAPAGSALRLALEVRLAAPLCAANHAALMRELLLVEELQQEADLCMYDQEGAVLEAAQPRGAPGLRLLVPGLAEARPSVMRGDRVHVAAAGGQRGGGRVYEGVVHGVALETVTLRFAPAFHAAHLAGSRYHVRFTLRRTATLLAHAAVAPGRRPPDGVLFPPRPPPADEAAMRAAVSVAPGLCLPAPLFNRRLNARQQLAVRGALFQGLPGRPLLAPYIIFGPPGTGKTSTMAEYVLQTVAPHRRAASGGGACAAAPSPAWLAGMLGALSFGGGGAAAAAPLPPMLLLVSAPSNAAADELASRLVQPLGPLLASEVVRANAFARPRADVPPALQHCSRWDDASAGFMLPTSVAQLRGALVVVATAATAQKMAHTALTRCFSHVCVDEAGQATEPELLCALTQLQRPGGARPVLAGDPRQLGPVLFSTLAAGLGVSLLERLVESTPGGPHARRPLPDEGLDGFHPAFTTLLTHNYRSHPALIAVPNALFYGGSLVAAADPDRSRALCAWPGLTAAARAVPGGFPLLFHGVEGEDKREGNSPSWCASFFASSSFSAALWARPFWLAVQPSCGRQHRRPRGG